MIETTNKLRKLEQQQKKQGEVFAGQSYDNEAQADDFVCDVLRLMRQLLPKITDELAAQADAALRERWGGDRPYIARRSGEGRSDRNDRIRRDYLAGERFELLERRYGLSQRQLIRVVKLG
jgi:Mor family transcriptional regulator